jgi:hypothetical protein
MITETTYTKFDLEFGKCTCCCDETDEIVIDDGRCIDCVEEEKFFEETMRGL